MSLNYRTFVMLETLRVSSSYHTGFFFIETTLEPLRGLSGVVANNFGVGDLKSASDAPFRYYIRSMPPSVCANGYRSQMFQVRYLNQAVSLCELYNFQFSADETTDAAARLHVKLFYAPFEHPHPSALSLEETQNLFNPKQIFQLQSHSVYDIDCLTVPSMSAFVEKFSDGFFATLNVSIATVLIGPNPNSSSSAVSDMDHLRKCPFPTDSLEHMDTDGCSVTAIAERVLRGPPMQQVIREFPEILTKIKYLLTKEHTKIFRTLNALELHIERRFRGLFTRCKFTTAKEAFLGGNKFTETSLGKSYAQIRHSAMKLLRPPPMSPTVARSLIVHRQRKPYATPQYDDFPCLLIHDCTRLEHIRTLDDYLYESGSGLEAMAFEPSKTERKFDFFGTYAYYYYNYLTIHGAVLDHGKAPSFPGLVSAIRNCNGKSDIYIYVHGVQGSVYDMKLISYLIDTRCLRMSTVHILCKSHTAISTGPIEHSAQAILCEVTNALQSQGLSSDSINRIHFIGFSLGAVLCRLVAALLPPSLQKLLGLFLSLNGPTIGTFFRNPLVSMGVKFMAIKNPCMAELCDFSDDSVISSLLFTEQNILPKFSSICLCGTLYDGFVPCENSVGVAVIGPQQRLSAQLAHSMLEYEGILKQIVICYDFKSVVSSARGIDNFIGKSFHVKILTDRRGLDMILDLAGV